ncbi:MAG: 3-dehydroquinate synthase [Peptococcaceae bacterium]|jgi:3-dehydroquinate synthase|nr:3-dehydroquinate synthase [Peptococcaceae bacterium]
MTMTQRVGLGANSYDILTGSGLLRDFGTHIAALCGSGVAVVTDSNLWTRYGRAFAASMESAGLSAGSDWAPVILDPGEHNKSLDGLGRLYSAFAAMKLRRGGLVAAFGGGVVGDLSGMAAATWMRGVRYVQIPTTLLAQVDSSVGGKTAINLDEGKNLAGVFYQPSLVLIDTDLPQTLPEREFRSGMAEVIKYGAIRSKPLFDRLTGRPDTAALAEIVAQCCRIKSEFVERDELDTGERMLLNFGHSFGHAIEKLGGYRRYNHGEAVAMGMALAAETGEKIGLTAVGNAARIKEVLEIHGLDTACPYEPEALLPQMELDKKNENGQIRLVLIQEIGTAFVHTIQLNELGNCLQRRGIPK